MKNRISKIAMFLVLALALSLFTVAVSATDTIKIPKATKAPTIDGKMSGDEWKNALSVKMDKDTLTAAGGSMSDKASGTYYWMWDDEGLYFFAEVTDSTKPNTVYKPNNGSYNGGDGIQWCIYPDITAKGNKVGTLYFWSLVVASDGSAEIGEHFCYGNGSKGADVEEATVACTQDGTNYTIEAFVPADCWTKSTKAIEMENGTTFAMTHVLMEQNGGSQSLLVDSGWFDGTKSNHYTLTSDVTAGPAPETTVPATQPVTTPTPSTTPSATPTADVAVVLAAVMAIAASGVVVAKKKH